MIKKKKSLEDDYKNNIQIYKETLKIISKGGYQLGNHYINLPLKEYEEAIYLSEERVKELREHPSEEGVFVIGRCGYWVENEDSFTEAQKIADNYFYQTDKEKGKILVLNFASPDYPTNGAKCGRKSQEADLCRKSTLSLSLESKNAKPFYDIYKKTNSALASDAMVLSPNVEIIRDTNNMLLEKPLTVSVLSCAAPAANRAQCETQELEKILYNRIQSILHIAAAYKYKYLVLGAWGCGTFGNDAKQMSDLFYRALKEFRRGNHTEKDYFNCIAFAVYDQTEDLYIYRSFQDNFENFYRDEDEAQRQEVLRRIKETEVNLDKIRGGLFGGAVGDALGYPVEFLLEDEIKKQYGEDGIQEYSFFYEDGVAVISDDTQMSLFTANGILFGDTRGCLRGIQSSPSNYVLMAYKDWFYTQTGEKYNEQTVSWLLDIPELYHMRAPGTTCMSALNSICRGYAKKPINQSKGCGGIMRVAPLGLHYHSVSRKKLDAEGANIAALTHGHPLGYIPAAILTHIVNVGVYGGCTIGNTLEDAVKEALQVASELFEEKHYFDKLNKLVDKAINFSKNNSKDSENIHELGEGWVAEETLAIAIYCSLRYCSDFSKGIIAAVNHSGDSDSTGAVTGNILGAWLGYKAIEDKWKQNLELKDVILEMADDLCHGCQLSEYSSYRDSIWENKYVKCHYKKENK